MNATAPTSRIRYAAERQEAIVDAAHAQGRVDVTEISERLGVTPETVRRDLTVLEQRGLVRRVHGGALPVAQTDREPSILQRLGVGAGEKQRIAERALAELPGQGTILLDSGTTTLALARLLTNDLGLAVVTNSVAIAAVLSDHPDLQLHLLGGQVRPHTGAAVGSWVERALSGTCIDVAFLGTNGFSLDRGLTTPDLAEADAKRAMIAASRRRIVLADASKAGLSHFQRFANVEEVSLLITDSRLDDETTEAFDNAGMEVARA